jgi:hypothetical protein
MARNIHISIIEKNKELLNINRINEIDKPKAYYYKTNYNEQQIHPKGSDIKINDDEIILIAIKDIKSQTPKVLIEEEKWFLTINLEKYGSSIDIKIINAPGGMNNVKIKINDEELINTKWEKRSI